VGTFFVQKLSLTATKIPSRGSGFPLAILIDDSFALFMAKSSVKVVNALNLLLKILMLEKSTNFSGQIEFSISCFRI
jgi:hypothetical protein